MSENAWHHFHLRLHDLLDGVSFRDAAGTELGPEAGFTAWCAATEALREASGTIYLIGNGASASMASHYSADLAKNAHVHTEVFSDLSLITAISNDIGYDQVFALPLERRARPGDMLVTISSSGLSPNIVAALAVARRLKLSIVTLSAMRPDNPSRAAGTLNVYVPAETYGLAETCHSAILHHWMDLVEIRTTPSKDTPRP